MKKILALILAAMMLCTFASCASGDIAAPDDNASQTDAQAVDYEAVYADTLELIRTALAEEWDSIKLEDNGLSYMLIHFEGDAGEELGYSITDINGDGVSELLVGAIADTVQPVIYMYTVADGAVVQVISGGERDAYYLCSDGSIANEGSSSAFLSNRYYFVLENGALKFVRGFIFDYSVSETEPAFEVSDADYEDPSGVPVSMSDAEAVTSGYEALYINPDFVALTE